MIVLFVNKKGADNEYTLQDIKTNQIYNLFLEFLDITPPDIGDKIKISKKLLDKQYEGYSKSYVFGDINSSYGRKITKKDDVDIIYIKSKERVIVLKRLYG